MSDKVVSSLQEVQFVIRHNSLDTSSVHTNLICDQGIFICWFSVCKVSEKMKVSSQMRDTKKKTTKYSKY